MTNFITKKNKRTILVSLIAPATVNELPTRYPTRRPSEKPPVDSNKTKHLIHLIIDDANAN